MIEFTASQIAEMLDGVVEGNPDVNVWTLSKIEEGRPGSLSFLANPLYTHYLYTTEASIVIVNSDFVPDQPVRCTLIRVENSYTAFARLLEMYNQIKMNKKGISPNAFVPESVNKGKDIYIGEFAVIGENVVLGDGAKIYPHCYVGENTIIGEGSTLFPGVRIYSDCIVGKRCTLHAGVIVGADGFGFALQEGSNYKKVPQIGNVVIEDDVEIGSNTCIDRATLGSTFIRKGVKLDNLIQIAHNVDLGENTVIASQSGIAGSTKVGKNCMFGGQVGLIPHLNIGDNVKIAAQSGIGGDLKNGEIVQGSPAFPVSEYRRVYVHFRNLNILEKRVRELELELKRIKEQQ